MHLLLNLFPTGNSSRIQRFVSSVWFKFLLALISIECTIVYKYNQQWLGASSFNFIFCLFLLIEIISCLCSVLHPYSLWDRFILARWIVPKLELKLFTETASIVVDLECFLCLNNDIYTWVRSDAIGLFSLALFSIGRSKLHICIWEKITVERMNLSLRTVVVVDSADYFKEVDLVQKL